jgi:glutathione S-transferase
LPSHGLLSWCSRELNSCFFSDTPTSCGAASFIAAHTLGLHDVEVEQVDLRTHKTSSGVDFYTINPKGNVPALVLDDGIVLNEGAAVLQYLADRKPEANLAGQWGTTERYLVQNFLNLTASEIHPGIGGLFGLNDDNKVFLTKRLNDKLALLEKTLKGAEFLVGGRFTVADSYLYIVLSWTGYLKVDLAPYPKTKAYFEFIAAQPNVVAAHKAIATNPTHA